MSEDQDFKVNDRRPDFQADEEGKRKDGCGGAAGKNGPPTAEESEAARKAYAGTKEHLLPKVTFSTFVLSLGSSAMVQLGEVPDPNTGRYTENLPLAKHTIDIIAMLKDKTCKCMDQDEARLLDGLLYELRMKYVCKTK